MPVEMLAARLPAVGIAERVLDGHAHVGGAEVGLHGSVGELDHRVDLALAVDDDIDGIDGNGEEMMRLDDLEALVHEGRGIDRDLVAHKPGGMRERIGRRNLGELGTRASEERASRAGEPDLVDGIGGLAREALEDGAVLGVDGDELAGGGERHEQVAADDDRLLVGIGQALPASEGGIARGDAHGTDERVDHAVDLGELAELGEMLGTEDDLGFRWECVEGDAGCEGGIGDDHVGEVELAGAGDGEFERGVHGDGDKLDLVGMAAAHVERLAADRARRAEKGDMLHQKMTPPMTRRI